MAATIPADLAQFYAQIIIVSQKLAYIYGWGDFSTNEISDEYRNMITLFIGVMSRAEVAEEGVKLWQKLLLSKLQKNYHSGYFSIKVVNSSDIDNRIYINYFMINI